MLPVLLILSLVTSGVPWIIGSDRAMAVSCYDGAVPRSVGVISARYSTPVRVNVLSGVAATAVVIAAHQISGGSAAKDFDAVLGVTISTTLISYLLIYPALWKLRHSHPDVPRPYRMPAHRSLTVVLMVLVAIATVQLIAPGAGDAWFGASFAPAGWKPGERVTYLLAELVPVAVFVAFWWVGQRAMRRRPESVVDLTDATYRPDTPATEPSPTWPSVRCAGRPCVPAGRWPPSRAGPSLSGWRSGRPPRRR